MRQLIRPLLFTTVVLSLSAPLAARASGLPPTAANDAYVTGVNSTLTVDPPGVLANDSDPEGDQLTTVVNKLPTSGILVLNLDGSFTYTPNTDFEGIDHFTYVASEVGGTGQSSAVVTITVDD